MVDKKVAAGVAVLAVAAGAAYALSRAEAAPVGEGAPEGEVSISITPLGMPEGFSFDDVQGAWGVGATIKVNGVCTVGVPIPSMVLELYDKGVIRKTLTPPTVVLGTTYTLTETMTVADVGGHTVYGRMVLSNVFGAYEFTSDSQSFDIGEEQMGDVDIGVTLTTP